jgi:NADH-quinone oxidoreductase subunit A
MTLLSDYNFIGIYAAIAIVFPFIALGLAWVLRPKKPNPVKTDTYECGQQGTGEAWVRFRAQYYIYALVFVVFDVEAVFLFPWAVAYNQVGLWALAGSLSLPGHPDRGPDLCLAKGSAALAIVNVR